MVQCEGIVSLAMPCFFLLSCLFLVVMGWGWGRVIERADLPIKPYSPKRWGHMATSNVFCLNVIFTLKCLSIGTPKAINFPFVPNGKLTVLSVPKFKHTITGL